MQRIYLANRPRSRWTPAKDAFYAITALAVLIAAIWLRLSVTGREWGWRFILRVPADAPTYTEHLAGYGYAMAGVMAGALIAIAILAVGTRRYGRTPPLGTYWGAMMGWALVFVGVTAYGHYFG